MGKTNSKFFPENKITLLNQNWVHFPTAQQSQFLLLKHQVSVRESTACIAWCQARIKGSSCSKDKNSLVAFKEEFLKVTFGVRVAGDVTFFSLAADEVTEWCLGESEASTF